MRYNPDMTWAYYKENKVHFKDGSVSFYSL